MTGHKTLEVAKKMEAEKESNKVAKEIDQHENENVSTALLTAGTVLLMACLKQVVLRFLIEQWRAWIFLVLHIILLAIFFTSIYSSSSETNQERHKNVEMGIEKKRKRKQCRVQAKAEDCSNIDIDCYKLYKKRNSENRQKIDQHENVEDDSEQSKEELNERVEAFIANFRQHLISDARKSRNQFLISKQAQAQKLKVQHKSNMEFSTQSKSFILKV